MNKLKILSIVVVVILILAGIWYWQQTKNNPKQSVEQAQSDPNAIPGYNAPYTDPADIAAAEEIAKKKAAMAASPAPQGSSNIDTIISEINGDAAMEQSISKQSDTEGANALNDQATFNFNYDAQLR
jgi:hypothetical protein